MDVVKTGKMLFVLSAASIVLPWFSFNPEVMGYCWGSEFYEFFLLPMLMVWYCLYGRGTGPVAAAAGILGGALNIAALVYILGSWPRQHNIASGFRFSDGFHTAIAGFWISAVLFSSLFCAITVSVVYKKKRQPQKALFHNALLERDFWQVP